MIPRDMGLAALTSVIWGLAFVATRWGLEGFTAAQLTALRFLIAGLPVLVVPRPPVPWRTLLGIGLSLFAGQFLLLFLAFRAGMPPGLAAVTQQTHVFLTVLLAAALLGERPTPGQWAGMGLAACGLFLVGLTVGADLPPAALALALAGALSWAVGNILLKRAKGVPMFPLVVWCSLVPPIPMLLLSFAWGEPGLLSALARAPWRSLAAAAYLGGAATSAYAIWGRLLARYPAAAVTPFALLAPIAGVLGSALAFDEVFPAIRYGGMAFVVAGVAVAVLRPAASARVP